MEPKVWEVLIILAIVILLFGPNRLAGPGAGAGKALREFRDALGQGRSGETVQGDAEKASESAGSRAG